VEAKQDSRFVVMWPGADVEKYKRDVQTAGLQSDSALLRWFAKNPEEVKQLPEGKWQYHDISGGVHETADLIGALVVAQDAARIRMLRKERADADSMTPKTTQKEY
jgi:hypothetical protein